MVVSLGAHSCLSHSLYCYYRKCREKAADLEPVREQSGLTLHEFWFKFSYSLINFFSNQALFPCSAFFAILSKSIYFVLIWEFIFFQCVKKLRLNVIYVYINVVISLFCYDDLPCSGRSFNWSLLLYFFEGGLYKWACFKSAWIEQSAILKKKRKHLKDTAFSRCCWNRNMAYFYTLHTFMQWWSDI